MWGGGPLPASRAARPRSSWCPRPLQRRAADQWPGDSGPGNQEQCVQPPPPPPGPGPTLLLTYIAFQFVASSFVPRISYLTYMVRASVSPSSSASCPPHPPTWPRPAPGKLHRPPPPITWRVSGPWREGAGGGRGSSTPWHPAGLAGVSFSRVPHPFKATREGASDLHPAPISKFCFTKSNRGNPTSVKQPTSPPPSPHVSPVRMRAGRVPLLRLSPPTHYMAALPVTSASSTGPYHSCFARSPPPCTRARPETSTSAGACSRWWRSSWRTTW